MRADFEPQARRYSQSTIHVSAFRAARNCYTVSMYRTQDLHVKEIVRLSSPRELKAQTPSGEAVNAVVNRTAAAIDGPYAVLDDEAGLRASAQRSRSLGYDGKWCIHPAQVAVINEGISGARILRDRMGDNALIPLRMFRRSVPQTGRAAFWRPSI